MRVDPRLDMLGVIDVQPTFMPGGALPVPDGQLVVPVINRLLGGPFRRAFATQDWHPPAHASFASQHAGRAPFDEIELAYGRQTLWPDHALQGSPEAALHADLDTRRIEMVIRKGMRPEIDSYSAFRENDRTTVTGLAGWLRALGIERVFFCGLALDYCVAWSAADAVEAGFESVVVLDATRAIGPEAETARALAARGIKVLASDALS
jgi:nicotinamidase/pyrazinamidase